MLENEPLAKYTSWRIGGPARYMANPATPDELVQVLRWARERKLPIWVLGGGTNTLASDAGFAGMVVRYRAQSIRIEPDGDTAFAHVDAGAPMAGTARKLVHLGWAGLEWAEGLPGTIGGAVVGNAGCYGGDIAGALTRAWLLENDTVVEWPVERFAYAYRHSILKTSGEQQIVLAAEFRLTRADPDALAEQMEQTAAQRRIKTPMGSSCGSVFRNPPGDSAGRLIEAAGLKGARVGNAEIAQKHANYILNLGKASSADVCGLIQLARETVSQRFGVELELEVQVMP